MSRLDFDLHRGQFRAFVSIETVDDRTVLSAHHECESWRELQPEERRALLAHLLAAEGLPGVEEIEKLRADADNAYSEGYEDGFAEGYDNGSEDGYERGYEQGFNDGPEPDDTALAKIRQSRLAELLEAEARERVEVETDRAWERYGLVVWRDDDSFCLIDPDKDEHLAEITPELLENLGWSCLAALAEKRRREGFEQ